MKQDLFLTTAIRVIITGFIFCLGGLTTQAQTTTFTYQGRITDGANQAPSGTYNMQFALFAAEMGGAAIQTLPPSDVTVTSGVFTVYLNFTAANAFDGGARYFEISLRKITDSQNPPVFSTLVPRQPLTSSPYSIRTLSAGAADSLSNACTGCVTDVKIDTISGSKVTGTVANAANATNAATAGNVSGVVAIANGGTGSSKQNFVDLTTDQTVGGNKTFTGVLSGDGSGLRNISGASVSGSTALNPQRLAILRWYDVNQATLSQPITGAFNSPQALAFDGTFVYVANSGNKSVTRIRASTGAVEGSAITVGDSPSALAFDGTFVYVANSDNNTISRIRARTGAVEGSAIAVGDRPTALAFDGTFVYVANFNSDTISRIRAGTGAVEGNPIAVGDRPAALAFDGTFIYAANSGSNTVSRIRARTGVIEGNPIAVGFDPYALVFDGTFIYVANRSGGNVSRIRAGTGAVEGSAIPVGGGPIALGFDGTFVYVANSLNANISRIRAATGTVEGTIVSGNTPIDFAFDGTFVYVANFGSNHVTRF